jgi:hypothetical protein
LFGDEPFPPALECDPEIALRQAALTRGRLALDTAKVATWLDGHCPRIGADQRVAVEGIASSDAAPVDVVSRPYHERAGLQDYAVPAGGVPYVTHCGT